jgi:hypothetical protein
MVTEQNVNINDGGTIPIPTERPPPVGEVSVNFCGYRGVTWLAQRINDGGRKKKNERIKE